MNEGDALPMDVGRIEVGAFVGEVVMKSQMTAFLRAAAGSRSAPTCCSSKFRPTSNFLVLRPQRLKRCALCRNWAIEKAHSWHARPHAASAGLTRLNASRIIWRLNISPFAAFQFQTLEKS